MNYLMRKLEVVHMSVLQGPDEKQKACRSFLAS